MGMKLDNNWTVIRSNRNISRLLLAKIKKETNIVAFYKFNTINYYSHDMRHDAIIKVLQSYKKQKFELCAFTEKQFSLTVNKIGYKSTFIKEVQRLPLSYRFSWYNTNAEGLQSVTPITNKQYNNIIKIN